jgi:hypothetical protein
MWKAGMGPQGFAGGLAANGREGLDLFRRNRQPSGGVPMAVRKPSGLPAGEAGGKVLTCL